jgi:hypothetical protein
VQKDVAGGKLWYETLDNVTDGLQLLLGNVLLFVFLALESSCLELFVKDRAPFITGVVRVQIRCLDGFVDGLAVGLTGHLCPPR